MFKVRIHDPQLLRTWADERDTIDMDPVYQRRGSLWTQRDKSYLIDSIINGFDIPKVYLADFTGGVSDLNPRKKLYAVIDGKQRLEAIFEFFDGKLLLDREFVYLQNPSVRLAGLGYKDIRQKYPKIASRFDNYNLTIMSVITDEDEKINELFWRLNKSKPLTGAEIRNAMSGAVPELIRRIAEHEFFKSRVVFATHRGQDRNIAAKLLLIEFRGRFVDTKKTHLDRLVRENRDSSVRAAALGAALQVDAESPDDPETDEEVAVDALVEEGILAETTNIEKAADRVRNVLNAMVSVFVEKDPLLRTEGPVTLYYWLIRNADAHRAKVRDFLVEFEDARDKNRTIGKSEQPDDPTAVDDELRRFDVMARAVNDRSSLEGRYELLHSRFERYLLQFGSSYDTMPSLAQE